MSNQALESVDPVVEAPKPKNSPALAVLSAALAQVQEVKVKSEQTLQLLQQNLNQVTNQRIGLQHQEAMLNELIAKIQQAEASAAR